MNTPVLLLIGKLLPVLLLIGKLLWASCSGCGVQAPVQEEENTPIKVVPILEKPQTPGPSKPASSQEVSAEASKSESQVPSKPEPGPPLSCHLTQTDSRTKEVSVNGHSLQFVKIDSGRIDNMALTEEQVIVFYRKAFQMLPSNSPVPPFIFKAVSDYKMPKVVPAFWIQAAPVSPALYREILPKSQALLTDMVRDGSLYKISYPDAREFIEALNQLCDGLAAFDLPTEKQFVYLARRIYDPVKSGELKHCHTLTNLSTSDGITQLLGYRWQLTKSKCEQFSMSSDPTRECNDRMYVKKGGTATSRNANECMPEYRAEASPRMGQPNTTFRLVLD